MYPRKLPEPVERHMRVGGTHLISVVRQISGQDDASIKGEPWMHDLDHVEYQGRAVGGQRVVETRSSRQVVGLFEVQAQQPLRAVGIYIHPIDSDLLAAHVAP